MIAMATVAAWLMGVAVMYFRWICPCLVILVFLGKKFGSDIFRCDKVKEFYRWVDAVFLTDLGKFAMEVSLRICT